MNRAADHASPEKPPADKTSAEQLLCLAAVLGHRTRGIGELLREGVEPDRFSDAGARLSPAVLTALDKSPRERARLGERLFAALQACGASFLPITSPRFPASLRGTPDPPPWLFVRGDSDCLNAPQIAVVGSRRASHAGLQLAETLSARLAAGGYSICSGLALGIDGAAHRGALVEGATVAVLGTGINEIYPARHRELAARILERGCLVSELPPGTAAHRGQFPRRNRIISGLAEATVIVEAALPSGSLHTAAAALEQGRDVFVLPWSVLHTGGAGCLYLLRDGATPLTNLAELDEHFPRLAGGGGRGGRGGRGIADDDQAEQLLTLIGDGSPGLSALLDASGLPMPELLALLGRLEAAGRLQRYDGGYAQIHCKSCQLEGS